MRSKTTIARLLYLFLALCLSLSVWSITVSAAGSGDIAIDAAHFPDDNFRTCVKWYDQDYNDILTQEEIACVTSMKVGSQNIESLQGIEYFTALEELYCHENHLTSLDVTKNTALTRLDCYLNQITNLDLSQNTELMVLECHGNQLTSLDVRKNEKLEDLFCNDNKLTTIDLSKNTALSMLGCSGNPLTDLDLTHNSELIRLDCGGTSLTSLDLSKNEKLEIIICYESSLTHLDLSHNPLLRYLDCNHNPLTELNVSKNAELDYLNCSNTQLTNVDVSKNAKLSAFTCCNNPLSSLDVSQNPILVTLECSNTQLTSLDVSHNPKLELLACKNNQLTSLDLHNNPEISSLYLDYNSYLLPQKHGFDYTALPGNFDIHRVSDVVGGSFDQKNHTFDFYDGETKATYTYDIGNGFKHTFVLRLENPFDDVNKGDFYYDGIIWAAQRDLAKGTTLTTFSPKQNCTRAQVVTFLWRAAGCREPKGNSPFKDVQDPSKFYYKAVLWAAERGITSGVTADTFNPNGLCTRAQVVTFLWRFDYMPEPQSTESPFVDVQDSGKFYYKPVLWATARNITTGITPDLFKPDGICTRGQIVTFLYRCLN